MNCLPIRIAPQPEGMRAKIIALSLYEVHGRIIFRKGMQVLEGIDQCRNGKTGLQGTGYRLHEGITLFMHLIHQCRVK